MRVPPPPLQSSTITLQLLPNPYARRTTDEKGNTRWEPTPLVEAAVRGDLGMYMCVLPLRVVSLLAYTSTALCQLHTYFICCQCCCVVCAAMQKAPSFTPLSCTPLNSINAVILDGIDRLSPGALASLQMLLHDRDISLLDGSRLLSAPRYDALIKNSPPALQGARYFV